MLIKINYNYVAAFLAIVLVVSFSIVEMVSPKSLQADITATDKGNNEEVNLPVVMYHHILKNQSRLGDYVISPTQFESDLKYIKNNGYTTISATDLIDFFKDSKPLPEKPIMITFDDGYEGVYEYAFPLLQKYNMKAIISIIGKHTDTFSKPDEPCNVNYAHISWEKLREMQKSGLFEIENHTYNMHDNQNGKRYGTRIKEGESIAEYKKVMYDDVYKLSDQIEKEVGVRPILFAYPFGALCKESKAVLTEMNFKLLLTCEEKVNHIKAGTELPTSIKRFNRASRYSTKEFFKKFE